MKRHFGLALPLLGMFMLFSSSCGIVKNVREITDKANQILEEVADLSRTLSSEVETGGLEASLANLIDERIEKLGETIENIIAEGSGTVFDEVNGTIDNTFDHISSLLEDIKDNVLGGSANDLLLSLSDQIDRQVNNLSAHAENLITIAVGNTSLLISQATDAAITLTVWLVFGIGMVLFIIVLIIWGKRMTKGVKWVVYSLIVIFLLLGLGILFVPWVKGQVLKSLNIGEEILARAHAPKVISVSPGSFEIGSNQEIILHGLHLDGLNRDSLEIGLYQGGSRKLKFPNNSILALAGSKITLGNFAGSSLGWQKLTYKTYQKEYKKKFNKNLPLTEYKKASQNARLEKLQTLPIVDKLIFQPISTPLLVNPLPGSNGSTPTVSKDAQALVLKGGIASSNFNVFDKKTSSALALNKDKWKNFFVLPSSIYNLKAGTYEIRITDKRSGETVASTQSLKMTLPPPPPPKPDLYPIAVEWANGLPVKGTKARLRITLGVEEGQEIKRGIKVGIGSNLSAPGLRDISVSRTSLQNASQNQITVMTKEFDINHTGNYQFTIQVDSESKIGEESESNNTMQVQLRSRGYNFKATVKFSQFTSKAGWGRRIPH